LARWNGIASPFVIHPGQLLRLTAPTGAVAVTRPAEPPTSQDRAVEIRPAPTPQATAPATTPATTASAPPPAKSPESNQAAGLAWRWPANGRVMRGFVPGDPARNGYDIGGEEGQPVIAAAPGQVVYSGSGLIGYGELIIIKHNDRLLSAYAHNRKRLVEEGASVVAGQSIAELGRNDRNEVLLHFEIRRDGRPVDPAQYLPAR